MAMTLTRTVAFNPFITWPFWTFVGHFGNDEHFHYFGHSGHSSHFDQFNHQVLDYAYIEI